jgi:hypothetical protein
VRLTKFPLEARQQIRSLVALYDLKRIENKEIINGIFKLTNKTVTRQYLNKVRKQIM